MKHTRHKPRFIETTQTNAAIGTVDWSWKKSLWISSMTSVAIVGGSFTFSLNNLLFFLLVTAIVLCFGHSLGMHRLLIHRSFSCPKWLEYLMVYLGSLVGLGGPIGMTYTHDLRDWAQRKPHCHDYFAHRQAFFKDAFWQMHCDIQLQHPPQFNLENKVKQNRFYHWLEKTWMLHEILWSLLFYWWGGIDWVIWGTCCRVAISVTGHWFIGYFAHRQGHRDWHINGAGVQGYNIKFCGLITFGECWHNNHHAFPGSAKLGLQKNQADPGWWVLCFLEKLDLVWDIALPSDLPYRIELYEI